MSLLEIRQLSAHARLGLWRIDEHPAGAPREREHYAVNRLLLAMTGDETLTIGHAPSGKPFLQSLSNPSSALSQLHISISHTKGYAVLLLSETSEVGVDIEYRSDRVERIASRFIRPDEQVETTMQKLLLWSAKETIYKLFSEDNLYFYDMRERGVANDILRMENIRREKIVEVHFEVSDDYVLTYAF
ncbi:MAG: 4'-phosphopantetheinyl transferase superfamily protein [Prevotella sp.]|nr:4'-phosphopantetheinyl transferase superfamily protein [Prevotella sp.]